MSSDITLVNADKISKFTGYTPEEIAIVKATVAKNTSDKELAYFLSVCKSIGLNPFNKEIWCYKDKKGSLLVFAGRDGFLKKAQENSRWNGIVSSEVCSNDEFVIDIAKGEVSHKPNFKDRGSILGAYAIVRPKNADIATVEWADIKVYDKKQFTWESHKAEMIKKVAEVHALKKAFGITGLQSEYDFNVKDNVVLPEIPDDVDLLNEFNNELDLITTIEDLESKAITLRDKWVALGLSQKVVETAINKKSMGMRKK